MARIVGVDLPDGKKVLYALPLIYGIGRVSAQRILSQTGIDPNKRVGQLSDEELAKIRQVIESGFKVEGELRADVTGNIKRLMEIGCYRGARHRARLPVRGQRTRTNARTRKGPRKTSGVIKVKSTPAPKE